MIKIGNLDISMKVGSDDVSAAYLGNELVYSGGSTPPTPIPYDEQYLTFVAKENGTFQFTNSVDYSLDSGSTWTTLSPNTDSPIVNAGDKILWKAALTPSSNGIGRFSSTGQFDAEGNIMSLLYGDNFIGETDLTGKNNAFMYLFNHSKIISAENLVLPATTLAQYCYNYMFGDCTSLTTAPELPATTLADYCYGYMFYKDRNLQYIICLATNINANFCTYNWVQNVQTNNGAFVKDANMTSWTTGNNGIPNNWTVIDNV